MKPEDKQLSLIDLFSRFHYGVRVMRYIERNNKIEQLKPVQVLNITLLELYISEQELIIKPYLRPMSSMTEEEENLFSTFRTQIRTMNNYNDFAKECNKLIHWLNKNMFDYRGLIPKGLALVAPEGMYNEQSMKYERE